MADYPSLTFVDLAFFSGRSTDAYDPQYSATAIAQATLLFKVATCLAALPDDAIQQELAKTGIMALAEQFVLTQPYNAASAAPFTSETIGSYSYSKAVQQVKSKENTGVMWFDLAVSELGVCDENGDAFSFGGIEMMEHDGRFTSGSMGNGNSRFIPDYDLDVYGGEYTRDPYKFSETD